MGTIRRTNHAINSGTMADVAFLLLIFFMVATTLQRENIIPMRLPPLQEGEPQRISEAKVLSIIINGNDEIRIEDLTASADMDQIIKSHLSTMINKGIKPIINVKMHPESEYQTYLTLLSKIKKGILETKQSLAKSLFPADYDQLSREQLLLINQKCGIRIMEHQVDL